MLKEGRTWKAVVRVPRDTGTYNMDVLVVANDFDSAEHLIKRTWTKASIQHLETAMYEAVVSGD